MAAPASDLPSGSRLALTVLVALVAVSPWPFGCTHPLAVWFVTQISLATALAVILLRLWRREAIRVPHALGLLAALFALGALQLIPLPRVLHTVVAPGSAAAWYPSDGIAAAVLGPGPRPISVWPDATGRAVALGLGIVLLAALSVPALRVRRCAWRSALVIAGSGLAVAVYGITARLLFADKLYGIFAVPTIRPFGPYVSKNHFAGYVGGAALLTAGLALDLAREARRGRATGAFAWIGTPQAGRVVGAAGAAIVMTLAVLVSLSRGGVLSLTAGFIALIALSGLGRTHEKAPVVRRALAAGILAAIAIAALLAIPPEARDRLRSLAAGRQDISTAFRANTWRDSLTLVGASPWIGHGLGTFGDAFPRFKRSAGYVRVEHAENDYLELLSETGMIGLAIALAALVWGFRSLRSDPGGDHTRAPRGLVHGASATVVATLVQSGIDFTLRIPSNALLVAAAAVTVVAAGGKDVTVPRWILAAVATAALALAATPGSLRALTPMDSAALRLQSRPQADSLRAERSRAMVDAQLRKRPLSAEAWLWLAWFEKAASHPTDAAALARYAVSLDPQWRGLRQAADTLTR